MYSPKELEGEVDHSFFDSDCEANDAEDGFNKQKASEKTDERKGQETHVLMDRIGTDFQRGQNDKDKARLEESRSGHTEEKESDNNPIEDGDVPFNGSSPIPSAKSSDTTNNSQSDEGSSVQSYSSDEDNAAYKHRRSSNSDVNSDDDGYHRSDDESESEEDERSEGQSLKQRGISHGTPKKLAGKFRNKSKSRSSSSGPESSHSSEEGSSAPSQKPLMKHHRIGSASQRERPKKTVDSEGTATDVTPLSTTNVSPAQSIDVALPPELSATDVQQLQPSLTEDSVVDQEGSEDQRSISSEGEDGPVLLKVEKQLDRVLVSSPGSVGSSRKNYSFSNEEVRRIDRENQRLLRELSRSSARARSSSSAFSSTSRRRNNEPAVRLYHSAINRQKEMERIQKENLAFLKRLESVKATPGLTREEQLADYHRQCRYLGAHNTAVPPIRLKTGRSSRPCSSPHKTRPEPAKPNRATPRPAWS